MRTLPFGLALVALSGCFGHCGPTAAGDWSEPGLWAELPAAAEAADLRLREEAPPPGLATSVEPLPTGFEPYAVTHVSWTPSGSSADREGLALTTREGRATVDGRFAPEASDAEVAARFLDFARNVTEADDLELERWAEGFATTREACGFSGDPLVVIQECYSVEVEGVDLAPVVEDVFGGEISDVETFGPGRAAAARDGWRLAFAFGTREVEGRVDGETVTLRVDPLDHASFTTPGSAEGTTMRRVESFFGTLGLGKPTYDDWEHAVVVC